MSLGVSTTCSNDTAIDDGSRHTRHMAVLLSPQATQQMAARYRPHARQTWWYASSSFTYSLIGVFLFFHLEGLRRIEEFPKFSFKVSKTLSQRLESEMLSEMNISSSQPLEAVSGVKPTLRQLGYLPTSYCDVWFYESLALMAQGFISYFSDVHFFGLNVYAARLDQVWATSLFCLQLLKSLYIPMDSWQMVFYGWALISAVLCFTSAQLCHFGMCELLEERLHEQVCWSGDTTLKNAEPAGLAIPTPELMPVGDDAMRQGITKRRGGVDGGSDDLEASHCFQFPAFPADDAPLETTYSDADRFSTLGHDAASADEYSEATYRFWTRVTRSLRLVPISRFCIQFLYRERGDSQTEEVALYRGFLLFHTFWHYSIPSGAWAWVVYTTSQANILQQER